MKYSHQIKAGICLLSLFASLSTNAIRGYGQEKIDFEAELNRATQLAKENKLLDALPILEKLNTAKPDHPGVLELLAYSLLASTVSEKDTEKRKQSFLRARQTAERAKKLGNNSQLIQVMLEQIPAEGDLQRLAGSSKLTPAEASLTEGEAAFAKGDLDRAIERYENALKLDSKLYEAPLFIGDAYYKMGKIDKAGESYARAIAIDPDRDTAYRYWGNVLMREGRLKEAREKLIEAVIAEPYSRAPWQFLSDWADRANIQLRHPRIDLPKTSVTRKDDKNISITALLSEKKDGTSAWTAYSLAKAGWMMDDKKFKEAYPNESRYRHSLGEEIAALKLTVESVQTQLKAGDLKESALDISIANLLKLHRAGLVEAYVLLAMPDEGIAHDYAEYRKNNRDKLRKYLNEFVTAGK